MEAFRLTGDEVIKRQAAGGHDEEFAHDFRTRHALAALVSPDRLNGHAKPFREIATGQAVALTKSNERVRAVVHDRRCTKLVQAASTDFVPAWLSRGESACGTVRRMTPKHYYIKEWRDRAGLSQQALGDRLGVTHVAIGRWERGERQPSIKSQRELADALGIRPIDLLRPPDRPSLDALLAGLPEEDFQRVMRTVRAVLGLPDDIA